MVLVNNLTVDSLATAMRTHLLPADADAVERARLTWELGLEGEVPQTMDDVKAFIDSLFEEYGENIDDGPGVCAMLVRVRGLLGEFMAPADADAAIESFRRSSESHTDEVKRVRRDWKTETSGGREGSR
ncbi:hypothetical protein [Arthrobacter sp. A5]|uniref:hypothetical protein n=1 Tax=Arthrobacter sp. A5 TaxID=576926 RepID=UPI003DA92807